MNVLVVLAHPRSTSLTGKAAEAFAIAATERGHMIEWADLVAERFDPVLREADEPDWNNGRKVYSAEVRQEMARIEHNHATVMFFPVFWWSVPAILKGWIDRVWNNGWAYGDRKFPQRRVWMVGIAGTLPDAYQKRGYDNAMQTQLNTGILGYCGVAEHRLELLYGSIDGEPRTIEILAAARALGAAF